MVNTKELRRLALGGDVFAILEFLDRLEDAEETKNNWLRANAPGGWIDDLRMERNALHARIKEMEKERETLLDCHNAWKELAERWEKERNDLRTRIEEMEKQEYAERVEPLYDLFGDCVINNKF